MRKHQIHPEYLYLYSYGTGLNDRQVEEHLQWGIAQYVKLKCRNINAILSLKRY
jgi:hypothetical protein